MREVLEMTRGCTALACFSTRTDCSKLARGSRTFLWRFQHNGENRGELKTLRKLRSVTSHEARTTARRSRLPVGPEARARRSAARAPSAGGRRAGRRRARQAGNRGPAPFRRPAPPLPARLPLPEAASGRLPARKLAGRGALPRHEAEGDGCHGWSRPFPPLPSAAAHRVAVEEGGAVQNVLAREGSVPFSHAEVVSDRERDTPSQLWKNRRLRSARSRGWNSARPACALSATGQAVCGPRLVQNTSVLWNKT